MDVPAQQMEWYIARSGQQYGPLSNVEFRKFIDLGHLKATDLVWREGYSDWRPASDAFPHLFAPTAPTATQQSAGGAAAAGADRASTVSAASDPLIRAPEGDATSRSTQWAAQPVAEVRSRGDEVVGALRRAHQSEMRERELTPLAEPIAPDRPDGSGLRRVLVILLIAATLGAGAWLVLSKRHQFMAAIGMRGPKVASVGVDASKPPSANPAVSAVAHQFTDAAEVATHADLQQVAPWPLLAREFPDWYRGQVQNLAKITVEKKDTIAGQVEAMVALRRRHQTAALGASLPRLRAIATAFLASLTHLEQTNAQACFTYVSQGETGASVLSLMQQDQHRRILFQPIVTTFEAVAEGRKVTRARPAPRQADYDTLQQELGARGWKQPDMQLFGDPKELAKAPPAKVCRMLKEWFAAQLSVKDPDVQLRLLVDALRPVVAG